MSAASRILEAIRAADEADERVLEFAAALLAPSGRRLHVSQRREFERRGPRFGPDPLDAWNERQRMRRDRAAAVASSGLSGP